MLALDIWSSRCSCKDGTKSPNGNKQNSLIWPRMIITVINSFTSTDRVWSIEKSFSKYIKHSYLKELGRLVEINL